MHLSYAGVSTTFDCSSTSECDVTVLAWLAGTAHEIREVTAGCRLALVYDLMSTGQSSPPILSTIPPVIQALRSALTLWNEAKDEEDTPTRLFYLLRNQPGHLLPTRADLLVDTNAYTVKLLNQVAAQLGFGLGLAIASCHFRKTKGGPFYEFSGCTGGLKEPEPDLREVKVVQLHDLEGDRLCVDVEFDEATDVTVPLSLVEEIRAGKASPSITQETVRKSSYQFPYLLTSPL